MRVTWRPTSDSWQAGCWPQGMVTPATYLFMPCPLAFHPQGEFMWLFLECSSQRRVAETCGSLSPTPYPQLVTAPGGSEASGGARAGRVCRLTVGWLRTGVI